MDEKQQSYEEAMKALQAAVADEAPLWAEIEALGSNPRAHADTTDLVNRWYAKRQESMRCCKALMAIR